MAGAADDVATSVDAAHPVDRDLLDEQFVVHDLRVVNGDKGLFVAMPSRKLPNGEFRDICHPINSETRSRIQDAVLAQFQDEGGLERFQTEVGY